MKATVSQAVSERPVEERGLLDFVNRELLKLLRQVRSFANYTLRERVTVDTAGAGAWHTIWASDEMPTNAVWFVHAHVAGITTSGVNQGAGYELAACYRSFSSTVAAVGSPTIGYSFESSAAINVQFAVDGRTITIQVRDNAVSPMRFVGVVNVVEALPA